jgi:rhamnulokinase
MGLELSQAQLSPKVLEFNITNEGGVDGTYRVLKNISGLWLVQQCKRAFERKGKRVDYGRLVNMAKSAPPLRSLIDPDDPRFVNPADMATAIQEFCRETHQPVPKTEGALIRCALESLALKYHFVLGRLEQIGGERVEAIHVVGGGSQNTLLNQFTADACERSVVAGPVEATALGNLLMQARACGEIRSLEELRGVVARSTEMKEFEPQKKAAEAWKEARERFGELFHGLAEGKAARTAGGK